jgi:nucleoside-diphosphate kinase
MEFTTILILPDVVKRGLVSDIVGRFERRGYAVIGLKMVHVGRGAADARYAGQTDASTKASALVAGPCVVIVVQGAGVLAIAQSMAGASPQPLDCASGTIRGDLGNGASSSIVEPATSAEMARADASRWFAADELTEPVLHACEKISDKVRNWAATHNGAPFGARALSPARHFAPPTVTALRTLRRQWCAGRARPLTCVAGVLACAPASPRCFRLSLSLSLTRKRHPRSHRTRAHAHTLTRTLTFAHAHTHALTRCNR